MVIQSSVVIKSSDVDNDVPVALSSSGAGVRFLVVTGVTSSPNQSDVLSELDDDDEELDDDSGAIVVVALGDLVVLGIFVVVVIFVTGELVVVVETGF
jgi:hypothetical protein